MSVNADSLARSAALSMSRPRWVWLQLLEACNLRCKMCYEWGDNGAYKERPVLKTLDIGVVRQIIEDCSPARPYYDLFGGEPLMYPHIDEVLHLIRHYGSQVAFPTNGTLLEKHAELIIETQPHRVWVSMDGPEAVNDAQRGRGVFKRAVKGLQKLHALREERGLEYPKIGIIFIITPLTYRHVEELFFDSIDISMLDSISLEFQSFITPDDHRDYRNILKEQFGVQTDAPASRGFVRSLSEFEGMDAKLIAAQASRIEEHCKEKGVYFNAYPQRMTEETVQLYFSGESARLSHAKKRCEFPWLSTEINARGDVTSCHALYDLSLGNVYEERLLDIWNGPRYKQYRNYLKKNAFPICQACCLNFKTTSAK
ncbi:radical SAM protein [Paenibacillus albicereus]|uniref:Radical SAM protein n=1 Tax=Paenibacillus albicereus TaxID=2726185 RepID=A0A6H2GUR8_9BACL|nr:radical SAM/SPASM domain-containing protein [Paenibacillus albicereus]QJC51171.1 radical SAM protein [Paenibacillus albicereus]